MPDLSLDGDRGMGLHRDAAARFFDPLYRRAVKVRMERR